MRQETSSRAQVGIACIGFFLASLFLTAYSTKNPAIARVGTAAVLTVVAPVLHLADLVRDGCHRAWSGYVYLVRTAHENRELKKKLSDAENRLALANEADRENLRLRQLLNFSSERQLRGITAVVIGGDTSGWVKGIVIDKGSSAGVAPGMAVVHPQGVVGQVVSVTPTSSKVLLVSDHASGVDVLMAASRARGVIEGAGERSCELKFVTKESQAAIGEQIITSGMDGVYPKGIVVGYITQVGDSAAGLFQPVEVKPAVDFSRLEEVLVVSSAAPDLKATAVPDAASPPQGVK